MIEMARASGLVLAGGAAHNLAVAASTVGTGQLVLRAVSAGAARIVVGCGGSATTDGGAGALQAIGSRDALRGAELVAACDVTTRFLEAAAVFAPQKGASDSTDRRAQRPDWPSWPSGTGPNSASTSPAFPARAPPAASPAAWRRSGAGSSPASSS